MNKLDLSYLDNIKDGIVKGLGECNLMGDIGYTATCVEMLKSLEQTKSIAIDNYRKLQTIEQAEPINDDNVANDNIQPLYGCPVPNRNGRIYTAETTNGAKIELTGYLSNFQSSIDKDDKPSRTILGKFSTITSKPSVINNILDYIMKQVKSFSDIIIQSSVDFMGSDIPWCMRIQRNKSECTCTILSADKNEQFFRTDDNTMTFKLAWEDEDITALDFFVKYTKEEYYVDDVIECDITELRQHLTDYFYDDYMFMFTHHPNTEFNCSMYVIYATLDRKTGFYHDNTLIVGNYEHPTDNKEEK
jgi:hypothetical protein